jgi:hypothetical protein
MKAFRLGAIALLVCVSAGATVLFTNGSPDFTNANDIGNYIVAESFSFNADTAFNLISFDVLLSTSGLNAACPGNVCPITWLIYANDPTNPLGAGPGTVDASGTANPVLNQVATLATYNAYSLNISIPQFTALNGVTYWMGLHYGDINTNFPFYPAYAGATSAVSLPAEHRNVDCPTCAFTAATDGLANPSDAQSFFTLSQVPEPSTWGLLALGCSLVLLRKKLPVS